jgi:hypothetical protein
MANKLAVLTCMQRVERNLAPLEQGYDEERRIPGFTFREPING